ncbi:MAG: hypothetical protein QG656_605 [Candidatus Hydrogenedentes bacterium]|nr:hypothetical protein [Candidatus Hydrogenedentota bacterium]
MNKNRTNRRSPAACTAVLACVLCAGTACWAALDDARVSALDAAFGVLTQREDAEQAAVVDALLGDAAVPDGDWQDYFRAYGDKGTFTAALARYWEHTVSVTAPDRTAYLSAVCAGGVVGSYLAGDLTLGVGIESASSAVTWLQYVGARLSPQSRGRIAELLGARLSGNPVSLAPLFAGNPRQTWLAMQLCLTLGHNCSVEGAGLTKLLLLPEATALFYDRYRVLLFDNGALNPLQVESLGSLWASIPPELHAIEVLAVPAAVGMGPDQPTLIMAGQIVYIDPISMDEYSNPAEFASAANQVAAPEFALTAAVNVFRAIQDVQFLRRPGLIVRRDQILARAQTAPSRYLRRFVPPALYMENPNELLPSVAYLWFIDSACAFRQAMELFEFRQREPMDALLLMADVLSGGGNSTLAAGTNPIGIVSSAETPVARTILDIDYLTGIGMLGSTWQFELTDSGSVYRYLRQ